MQRARLVFWAAMASLCWVAALPAQVLDHSLWQTDGPVYAQAEHEGTLYVGGNFRNVGPYTGSFVGVDASTAELILPLPELNGSVLAMKPDGNGGWYLGGTFTQVGGAVRNGLAQLDSNNQLTSWNPNVSGTVYDLDVSGSNVYFGGLFSAVGGIARVNLAAVDKNTAALTNWTPSTNGTVYTLDVHTHQVACPQVLCGETWVYFGGTFSLANGQARSNLARVDPTSAVLSSWAPNPDGAVHRLFGTGSTQLRVWIAGAFSNVAGVARGKMASITSTGSATSWNPNANGTVTAMVLSGSTIYAGGSFTSIGGLARSRIAAVDTGAGSALAWNPGASSTVYGLAVDGTTVYAVGDFANIGGAPQAYAAAIDAGSGFAYGWDPRVNALVGEVAVSNGVVFLGGNFTSANTVERNHLAAFDLSTGAATPWNPNAGEEVGALAVDGPIVYAGGSFLTIGGADRQFLAALDATTGSPTAWDPSPSSEVFDILVLDGAVYVGGMFDAVDGVPRQGIAALDPATGAASAWDPAVTNSSEGVTIRTLASHGGLLYFGGSFDAVGGQPRSNAAAVDPISAAPASWAPGVNYVVHAIEPGGAQMFLGGLFTQVNGSPRAGCASVDPVSAALNPWIPLTDGWVYDIASNGTRVYVGGYFTKSVVGTPIHGFIEVDALSGAVTPFDTELENWTGVGGGLPVVASLLATPNRVYVGGDFFSVGGEVRQNLGAVEVQYEEFCDSVDAGPSWPSCGTPLGSTSFGVPWVLRSAGDDLGGAYTSWYDQLAGEVRVQHVLADGSIAAGWPAGGFPACPDSAQSVPALVEDGSGGVFVAWRGWSDGLSQTRVLRLLADGSIAAGWPADGLSVPGLPVSMFSGGEVRAASDGFGGLYVCTDQFVQRLDGAGDLAAGWSASGLQLNDSIDQIIPDGSGNAFFVTLTLTEFGRIDAIGVIAWQGAYPSLFIDFDAFFNGVKMIPDGAGGFYVAGKSGSELRVQRIDSLGGYVAPWSPYGFLLFAGGELNDIVLDDVGGVYVAYSEPAAPYVLRVDRLTASGGRAYGWLPGGVVVGATGQTRSAPGLASDGGSGVIVSWMGWTDPSSTALYAARICHLGTPAPSWSLAGNMICPDAKFYTLGPSSFTERGFRPDGFGGAFVPWFRRDGAPGYSGEISLLRLGSTPPALGVTTLPAGSPSQAMLDGVSLEFDEVTNGGELYITRIDAPSLPGGYQTVPTGSQASYDISTNATFSGSIEVCIDYDPNDVVGSENALTLMHYEGGQWVDITTGVDTNLHRICGTSTSLSPFAIVESAPTATDIPAPRLVLDQNHPNPFNPRTTISFRVGARGPVQLSIYDTRGRLVRSLADGVYEPGSYEVIWTGDDVRGQSVASGVYFYRLTTPQATQVRRMAMVR